MSSSSSQNQARKIILTGIVQAVGFRPFIYLHAQAHKLGGWVRNSSGRVEIHVQGQTGDLDSFVSTLIDKAPALSRPVIESTSDTACLDVFEFSILPSQADENADIHLPADLFTCHECLLELNDTRDRRYRYPFINCTQCGPRYTLIQALPYDRVNTSMSGFPLCAACEAEYTDPTNRRYHAEPVACEACGPALTFRCADQDPVAGNDAALQATVDALNTGNVIAVKGIGGYHLMCDARNDDAVNRLRETKPRPDKPLAVMFPAPAHDSLATIREYLFVDDDEARILESAARPIVLIKKREKSQNPDKKLSAKIAPGLSEIGSMLPYSPLHHILLNDFNAPLVASSANISGEPVLTDNAEVEQRLSHVATAFLHHDRPIVRPADDPVIRIINGLPAQIRQGRGLAPVEIDLPFALEEPVLAVGTQMKNSIALAWGSRAVVSPHIGEMDNPRSMQTFEQCVADLQSLYQVEAKHIVCDAHPGYTATRWAHQHALPSMDVYHHHAHASAAYLETMLSASHPMGANDRMLVFTWDGVGLGNDGTLWGGEALLGRPSQWQRCASFRPFRLPGGERAGREPWRSAAAVCWEAELECPLAEASDPLLFSFWQQGKNSPQTTAAGRLFDAASALCGLGSSVSFEGQGPMQLEARAAAYRHPDEIAMIPLPLNLDGGILVTDWAPLIPMLTDISRSTEDRAACFHLSLSHALLEQALRIRKDSGVKRVGLSGGVFQNRVLTEKCIKLLREHGFHVPQTLGIPVNDAGISIGQIVELGYHPEN